MDAKGYGAGVTGAGLTVQISRPKRSEFSFVCSANVWQKGGSFTSVITKLREAVAVEPVIVVTCSAPRGR